jgi:predicted outer membrane repeat protein
VTTTAANIDSDDPRPLTVREASQLLALGINQTESLYLSRPSFSGNSTDDTGGAFRSASSADLNRS